MALAPVLSDGGFCAAAAGALGSLPISIGNNGASGAGAVGWYAPALTGGSESLALVCGTAAGLTLTHSGAAVNGLLAGALTSTMAAANTLQVASTGAGANLLLSAAAANAPTVQWGIGGTAVSQAYAVSAANPFAVRDPVNTYNFMSYTAGASSAGFVTWAATLDATNSTTAANVMSGGLAVAKSVQIGTSLTIGSTLNLTTLTANSMLFIGASGGAVIQDIQFYRDPAYPRLVVDTVPVNNLGTINSLLIRNRTTITLNGTYNGTSINNSSAQAIATGITNSGYICGVYSDIMRNYNVTGDTGTLALLMGQRINVGHFNTDGSTPTTTAVYGSYIDLNNMTGSIGSFYGVAVVPGTVTNAPATTYGVYVGNLGGTIKWAFYQDDSNTNNSFVGKVLIGTSTVSGTSPLQVVGQAFYYNGSAPVALASNQVQIGGGSVWIGGTVSAVSSITGTLNIGNGSTATTVGIGGGNVNIGGALTTGVGAISTGSAANTFTVASTGNPAAIAISAASGSSSQLIFQIGGVSQGEIFGNAANPFAVRDLIAGTPWNPIVYTTGLASAGFITLAGTLDATSSTAGAFIVSGGAAIAKAAWIGSTLDTTAPQTGALVVAGGASFGKSLCLGLVAAPGTLALGQIWQDSTQQCLFNNLGATTANLLRSAPVQVIFTSKATLSIGSFTAATSMIPAGIGSLTIPANYLTVGKTIRIRLVGGMGNTSGTVTFAGTLGGAAIFAPIAVTTGAANGTYLEITMDVTVITTGVSGSVSLQGKALLGFNGAATLIDGGTNTGATLNTTASATIGLTCAFSLNSGTNQFVTTSCTVEVLN